MSYSLHQESAAAIRARCAVVTLSDTRNEATDKSGQAIKELLNGGGHQVVTYQVIPDDADRLDRLLTELIARADVDVVFTNGGTGISQRDTTVPVIAKHLTTAMPGFGELFRMLSFEQIG